MDILSALTQGLQLMPQHVTTTKEIATKFLNHPDYTVQKKAQRLLYFLIRKIGETSFDNALKLYKWMESTKQPISKIYKLRIIAELIDIMFKMNEVKKIEIIEEIDNLLNKFFQELIILGKGKHKKASTIALKAITQLSILLNSPDIIASHFKKIKVLLADRSPKFRLKAIALFGILLHQHYKELSIDFIIETSNMVVLLLKEQDKDIVGAVMNYIKILVTVLSKQQIENYIDFILNALLVWTGKYREDLKVRIGYTLKLIIKKTSGDLVKAKASQIDSSLNDVINKFIETERGIEICKRITAKREKEGKLHSSINEEDIAEEEEDNLLFGSDPSFIGESIPAAYFAEDKKEHEATIEKELDKIQMTAKRNQVEGKSEFMESSPTKKQKATEDNSGSEKMDYSEGSEKKN